MASKQFGKLRQWAGEKVTKTNKSNLTEEFQELAQDVELRGAGVERLAIASDAYIKSLLKKKESETDPTSGKMLPIESLGLVMIGHGDEFGSESAYGQSLVKFGRAQSKIATLQEEYANELQSTYYHSLEMEMMAMDELKVQRKKLESRRLAMDAALTRVAKAKKEKDKIDADEELSLAKTRYAEMSEDVQERMLTMQEHEMQQLLDLSNFLDTQLAFVADYQTTLLKLQEEWPSMSNVNRLDVGRPRGTSHAFNTRASAPTPSPKPPKPPTIHHFDNTPNEPPPPPAPPVRPRARSDSVATNGSTSKTRKVSGWVGSVRSRRGSVKNFQHLGDDEVVDRAPTPSSVKARSFRSGGSPQSRRHVVRAIYDFAGTAVDELAFRKGDEIVVIGEVTPSDEWVRGEMGGRTGLFPLNYTEEVSPSSSHTPSPSSDEDGVLTRSPVKLKPKHHVPTPVSTAARYDEPFGDHHAHQLNSPYDFGTATEDDSNDDDSGDDDGGLLHPPAPTTRPGPFITNSNSNGSFNIKRAPPPPPPARRTQSSLTIPTLNMGAGGGTNGSAPRLPPPLPARTKSLRSVAPSSKERSPFESDGDR